jgi:hypothetical protein
MNWKNEIVQKCKQLLKTELFSLQPWKRNEMILKNINYKWSVEKEKQTDKEEFYELKRTISIKIFIPLPIQETNFEYENYSDDSCMSDYETESLISDDED